MIARRAESGTLVLPRPVIALIAAAGVVSAAHALRPAFAAPLPTLANRAEVRMQDFRDALYFPIREFLGGGNPYHPAAMFAHWPVRQDFNLYQPYHLVLHLPFALPGYRIGAVAFALVSLLLLAFLGYLAARQLRSMTAIPVAAGTIALSTLLVTSQVGKAQLYLGQINPLVAVGAAGALIARERWPRLAAVALAIAWLKPQFGLPLAVLLCCLGSRRVALNGTLLAVVAALPVLVVLIANAGGAGPFTEAIAANLAHATQTDYGAVNSLTAQRIDLPAVLFRVTGWLPPAAEPLMLIAVLAVTMPLVRRLAMTGRPEATAVAELLGCLAVVVCVVHQPGDVLIAVPAMTLAAAVWWQRRREPGWGALGVAVFALAVPFLHLHVVDVAIGSVFGARGSVTVDGVAVIVAWLALVVFAARWYRLAAPTALTGEARA